MNHPFITDSKYRWGALFLLIIISAFYRVSFIYNDFKFANIFTGVMVAVTVVSYFKLKRG